MHRSRTSRLQPPCKWIDAGRPEGSQDDRGAPIEQSSLLASRIFDEARSVLFRRGLLESYASPQLDGTGDKSERDEGREFLPLQKYVPGLFLRSERAPESP